METTVRVNVELFGTARMACSRRQIEVDVPSRVSVTGIASVLAAACPQLVGIALREDLGGLMASYTLNLNATEFIEGGVITLSEGDTLLLFSSQAGG